MMMKILNKPILSLSSSTTVEQQFHFHFSMTVDGTIKAFPCIHLWVPISVFFVARPVTGPWSASDHGDAGGSAGVSPTQRSQ